MRCITYVILLSIHILMLGCRSESDLPPEELLGQWNDLTTIPVSSKCYLPQSPIFLKNLKEKVRPFVVEYIHQNNLQQRVELITETASGVHSDELVTVVINTANGHYTRLRYNLHSSSVIVNFGESSNATVPTKNCELEEVLSPESLIIYSRFNRRKFDKVLYTVY